MSLRLRQAVRRWGFDIVRYPQRTEMSKQDALGVFAQKGVPILSPLSTKEYFDLCAPLFKPARRVPPDFEVRVHRDLHDAVDNVSMRNYVRSESRADGIYLSDTYPESHYYSRQRMLATIYERVVGGLAGKNVLDIGCSSGYYCFYASHMGAREVLGFDARPEHEEQFRLLHETLAAPDSCAYRNIDMEYGFETLDRRFDVVLAMGTIYHVYDHARFLQNIYRSCDGIAVIEGECSGRADNFCQAHLEDVSNVRSAIHGPVIYPSASWVVDLMRWVGFRNVQYVELPEETEDRWGFHQLRRAMFVGEK